MCKKRIKFENKEVLSFLRMMVCYIFSVHAEIRMNF